MTTYTGDKRGRAGLQDIICCEQGAVIEDIGSSSVQESRPAGVVAQNGNQHAGVRNRMEAGLRGGMANGQLQVTRNSLEVRICSQISDRQQLGGTLIRWSGRVIPHSHGVRRGDLPTLHISVNQRASTIVSNMLEVTCVFENGWVSFGSDREEDETTTLRRVETLHVCVLLENLGSLSHGRVNEHALWLDSII